MLGAGGGADPGASARRLGGLLPDTRPELQGPIPQIDVGRSIHWI